jgi:cytochrome P450
MALYPEVQKKAQSEIDAVVGLNRLPDFQDRPSLPYINAVVKESTRWNLVLPLGKPLIIIMVTIITASEGLPHMATNDDEYNGYHIPKGTLVVGNAWSVQPLSLTLHFVLTYLGRYCTTLKFSTTLRNSNPRGF